MKTSGLLFCTVMALLLVNNDGFVWILDYKRIDGDIGFDDVTMAARGHIPGELWVARHHAGAAQLIRLDGKMPTDIHTDFPNFTRSNAGTLRGYPQVMGTVNGGHGDLPLSFTLIKSMAAFWPMESIAYMAIAEDNCVRIIPPQGLGLISTRVGDCERPGFSVSPTVKLQKIKKVVTADLTTGSVEPIVFILCQDTSKAEGGIIRKSISSPWPPTICLMKSELNMAYPDSNVIVDISVGTRSRKLYILSSDIGLYTISTSCQNMKQILHTPSYAYAQLLAPAFRDASIGLTADETQIVITTYGVHNLPQYNMIVTFEIAALPEFGINALKILCSGFGELKANEEPTPCTLPNPRRSSVFFLGNSSDILIYEGWSDSSYNLFALRVTDVMPTTLPPPVTFWNMTESNTTSTSSTVHSTSESHTSTTTKNIIETTMVGEKAVTNTQAMTNLTTQLDVDGRTTHVNHLTKAKSSGSVEVTSKISALSSQENAGADGSEVETYSTTTVESSEIQSSAVADQMQEQNKNVTATNSQISGAVASGGNSSMHLTVAPNDDSDTDSETVSGRDNIRGPTTPLPIPSRDNLPIEHTNVEGQQSATGNEFNIETQHQTVMADNRTITETAAGQNISDSGVDQVKNSTIGREAHGDKEHNETESSEDILLRTPSDNQTGSVHPSIPTLLATANIQKETTTTPQDTNTASARIMVKEVMNHTNFDKQSTTFTVPNTHITSLLIVPPATARSTIHPHTTPPQTTHQQTILSSTTAPAATEQLTTVSPSTKSQTTVPPTTAPSISAAPIIAPPTNTPSTTTPLKTASPTTGPPTTAPPTTVPQTAPPSRTTSPTTTRLTTVPPTTDTPTTTSPITTPKTTAPPITAPITTIPPSNALPTTAPQTVTSSTLIPIITAQPTTTAQPTSAPPTVVPQRTISPTTTPLTTVPPMTSLPTTAPPTTTPLTTTRQTTISLKTAQPSTPAPTILPSTTVTQMTPPLTTARPKNVPLTTATPKTAPPTTVPPITTLPTTFPPTIDAPLPTTTLPTKVQPMPKPSTPTSTSQTAAQPPTAPPASAQPTTDKPTTVLQTTQPPTTDLPIPATPITPMPIPQAAASPFTVHQSAVSPKTVVIEQIKGSKKPTDPAKMNAQSEVVTAPHTGLVSKTSPGLAKQTLGGQQSQDNAIILPEKTPSVMSSDRTEPVQLPTSAHRLQEEQKVVDVSEEIKIEATTQTKYDQVGTKSDSASGQISTSNSTKDIPNEVVDTDTNNLPVFEKSDREMDAKTEFVTKRGSPSSRTSKTLSWLKPHNTERKPLAARTTSPKPKSLSDKATQYTIPDVIPDIVPDIFKAKFNELLGRGDADQQNSSPVSVRSTAFLILISCVLVSTANH